ncbi:MAG: hypothetical protein RL748_4254 [Pseudomonadota bacterium]|jgi:FkbM family methyltransferase
MNYFTSYAQNFEDVLLWRALKQIKNGFYIDVGANDPEIHSVTKAFYERGWYGINIEPVPEHIKKLTEERPRDINLGMAAGSSAGELTLYDVPEVRGWASPDQAVAQAHQQEGYSVAELRVPVQRLDAICAQHVDRQIHFLKIDVEGFESEVLRGMDFQRWRPWIVVVEATLPNSQVTNHQEWEHLITDCGYQFCFFDGLNRYYVAAEQAHLAQILAVPVNVFDEFITVHLASAWRNLEQQDASLRQFQYDNLALRDQTSQLNQSIEEKLHQISELEHLAASNQARAEQAEQQASHAEQQAAKADAWGQDLQQRLLANEASLSWRITRPLRAAKRLAQRHLVEQPFPLRLLGLLKRGLVWLARREAVRKTLLPQLARFPRLRRLLQQQMAQIRQDPEPPAVADSEATLPEAVRALPASARRVLADLTRHSS